jgi:hypothetical protein
MAAAVIELQSRGDNLVRRRDAQAGALQSFIHTLRSAAFPIWRVEMRDDREPTGGSRGAWHSSSTTARCVEYGNVSERERLSAT